MMYGVVVSCSIKLSVY